MSKRFYAVFLSIVLLFMTGCAWQKIPVAPEYTSATPIPLKIGITLADNQASAYFGPSVVKEWSKMQLFDYIIYPYREADEVDSVMKLSINGEWKGSGAGAGIIIGLTLGLAGAAIGPSMTGTHEAEAAIKSPNKVPRSKLTGYWC